MADPGFGIDSQAQALTHQAKISGAHGLLRLGGVAGIVLAIALAQVL